MYLVYNSVLLPENDVQISAGDRSFQYGDGLFETLRYQQGRLMFWPDHYDRLTRGMAALHLDPPDSLTAATLHDALVGLLAHNGLTGQTARIRIQVWRQTGGLYTPTSRSANILITAREGQPFRYTEKKQLGIYDAYRLVCSPVSAYKTTSALPYVLAGLAKQAGGFDDVVLLDSRGCLAECVASALFWLRDETLFVPALETGCIDGILRRQLLRLAPGLGFRVQEGLFMPDELAGADAVFAGNVMGIQRFETVNGVVVNEKKPLRAGVEEKFRELFAGFP